MAYSFYIDPSQLPIAWSTGQNYRIAITPDFAKTTDAEAFSNKAITTASSFQTFTSTLAVSTSSPVYGATNTSFLANYSLTYNRRLKGQNTATNYYLWEKTSPNDILITTIPSTSTQITRNANTLTFNIKNYLLPLTTYYITNDAGTVFDLYKFTNSEITNDSLWKWTTEDGTVVTGTNFTNINEVTNNGLVKYANIYWNNTVTSNTGTLAIYRNGSLYQTWHIQDTTGISISGNRLRVKTNSVDTDVAPEGNYYILFETAVLNGTGGSAIGVSNPNKVAWTNTVVKNIGNYSFTTGSNYLFTATVPEVIFTEGVNTASQNKQLILELQSQDGAFYHATTGTNTGSSWIFIGTQTQINNLWSGIYYVPTIYTNNTFTYKLSAVGATEFIANSTRNLTWIPPVTQFGATMTVSAATDAYRGLSAPFVKTEIITLRSEISTSTQILDSAFFKIDGATVGSAPYTYNNGINKAELTATFATAGVFTIQAIWNGGVYNSLNYAGLTSSTQITIEDGYLFDNFTVATTGTKIINEIQTITASFNTSSTVTSTLTFYANGISLGQADVNTATMTAVVTATFATSGTYNISAVFPGGNIDDHRYYTINTATTTTFIDSAISLDSVSLNLSTSTIISDLTSMWSTRPLVTATLILNTSTSIVGTVTFTAKRFVQSSTATDIVITNFTPANFTIGSPIDNSVYIGDPMIFVNQTQGLTIGKLFTIRTKNNAWIYNFTVTNVNTVSNTVSVRETNIPYNQLSYYMDPFMGALGLSRGQINSYKNATSQQCLAATQNLELLEFWTSPADKIPLQITGPAPTIQSTDTVSTVSINNNSATTSFEFVDLNYPANSALTTGMNISAVFNGQSIAPPVYPKSSNTQTVTLTAKSIPVIIPNQEPIYQYGTNGSLISNWTYTATIVGQNLTGFARIEPILGPYDGIPPIPFYTGTVANGVITFTASMNPFGYNYTFNNSDYTLQASITYLGDNLNSNVSTGTYISFPLYRPTSLSYIVSNTGTITRPTTQKFVVQTTGTIFNGSTINFYDNNVFKGGATVVNTTATFTYASSGTTIGSHSLRAEFKPINKGYGYASTTTNFTIT